MKIPSRVRYFNKRFLNRLTRKIAYASWGPFSMIYHVGRRSGKTYETPIIVVPAPDFFVIALTYGPEVDWYRNITATGRCKILWHRQEFAIVKIEPMSRDEALSYFPSVERAILKRIGIQDFIKLTKQVAEPVPIG